MTRAAIGLVLGCLTAVGVLPQTDEGTHLTVSPPPIIWIDAGTFVMGADDRDVDLVVAAQGRARWRWGCRVRPQ